MLGVKPQQPERLLQSWSQVAKPSSQATKALVSAGALRSDQVCIAWEPVGAAKVDVVIEQRNVVQCPASPWNPQIRVASTRPCLSFCSGSRGQYQFGLQLRHANMMSVGCSLDGEPNTAELS
jgi:hypothetical protein